mmetsp:Transcript_29227/g.33921  ORF Transcript_29227/g.33921 Transcript_29227/m.33921 type:complete len:111 (+) Transcript_29227:258-590(+)
MIPPILATNYLKFASLLILKLAYSICRILEVKEFILSTMYRYPFAKKTCTFLIKTCEDTCILLSNKDQILHFSRIQCQSKHLRSCYHTLTIKPIMFLLLGNKLFDAARCI